MENSGDDLFTCYATEVSSLRRTPTHRDPLSLINPIILTLLYARNTGNAPNKFCRSLTISLSLSQHKHKHMLAFNKLKLSLNSSRKANTRFYLSIGHGMWATQASRQQITSQPFWSDQFKNVSVKIFKHILLHKLR